MNLVLLETSGNQRYIFATNKLRENVGASELTYRVGTKTVLEAVEEMTKEQNEKDPAKQIVKLWADDLSGERVRANLLNPSLNPKLEDHQSDIEVIVATSGKAILLVRTAQVGKDLIKRVTQTALREMPGLTVHGAISSEVEGALSNIHEAVVEVHHKLEDIRYQMPSNEQRFLRLPFFAPCDTSGLPAQDKRTFEGEDREKLYSRVSSVKADNKKEGQRRIKKILNGNDLIEPLEIYNREWLAIIHADGNGLGAIFQDFKNISKKSDRDYVDVYREFSLALDDCTIKATNHALNELKKNIEEEKLPIVPLVLGGDDLTVLCDGKYALKFTHDFLKQFEEETSQNKTIWRIANNAFGNKDENEPSVKRLGICAGIAIVKPHFPFHQAYELAESLLRSAKEVKQKIPTAPSSAMDFHILYDSAYSDLDLIREKLRVDGEKTHLYAKPYVVTDEDKLKGQSGNEWLKPRRFSELQKRVEAIRAPEDDDNKRKLPNSQLHGLREALYLGRDEADARTKLIAHRYKEKGFAELLCDKNNDKPSLFFDEKDGEKHSATHFLDALDVIEFWKGFPEPKSKSDSARQPDNGDETK